MQLLNAFLGTLIVLVSVNTETTAQQKISKSTPPKLIPSDKLDKVIPYVLKKFKRVGRDIRKASIANRKQLPDSSVFHVRERFDAEAGIGLNYDARCTGFEYRYPRHLVYLIGKPLVDEQAITGQITIVSTGSCQIVSILNRPRNSSLFQKLSKIQLLYRPRNLTLLQMVAKKFRADSHYTKDINVTTASNFRDISHAHLRNKTNKAIDGSFDAVVTQHLVVFNAYDQAVKVPALCVGIQFRFYAGNVTFVPRLDAIPANQNMGHVFILRRGNCTLLGPNPLRKQ